MSGGAQMKELYVELGDKLLENSRLLEEQLSRYMNGDDDDYGVIYEAQRYSLLGGGKRIRSFLVNECCRVLGGDLGASMPLACAVEMIHTYSLIHDDLPCMDDDDMRRGKPSNHKVFGYANALLAGDALLTGAFRVIAEAEKLDGDTKARAISLLSRAAGDGGMIGGQVMDLAAETQSIDFDTLTRLHAHKTGAMIRASVALGCMAAGYDTDSEEYTCLVEYAEKIGLAFQVLDDVLDATATEEQMGKSVRSDAEKKTTFLSFYNVDEAKRYAGRLTADAISRISHIEGSETLTDLACYLLDRQN